MRSKLRHPIRAIREPFGTAGLILACIALIAALGGSAIAAKGGLTGKQKKEVKKIAKKFAGKPGAPGAPGAAGPAGPQGPAGAPGNPGVAGKDGTNGTNGTNGVSPTGTSFAGAKGGCTEGGVEFNGVNTTFACNGAKGAAGQDGQTGFTETLPPGETLEGTWAILTGFNEAMGVDNLSFVIPYPGTVLPKQEYVRGAEDEEENVNCPGSAKAPEAKPGYLCVYSGLASPNDYSFNPTFANFALTFSGSAVAINPAQFTAEEAEVIEGAEAGKPKPTVAFGTWAVTAPTS